MNPHPPTDGHGEHDRIRELLGAHALGQLDDAERTEIVVHLTECDDCRREYAALAPLAAPLANVDPDTVDPDAGLDARDPEPTGPSAAGLAGILARVAHEQALDPPTLTTGCPTKTGDTGNTVDTASPSPRRLVVTSVRPATPAHGTPAVRTAADGGTPAEGASNVVALRPRRRTVTRLLAAACVVLAFGLGAGAADLASGWREDGAGARPVAVQPLAPGIDAGAGTIDHTWGVEVVLTATGFAPGQTYDVAVLGRDGRTVTAGAFIGTGDTEMVCHLNASVLRDEADGFVVTDPAGTEVLRSRFT